MFEMKKFIDSADEGYPVDVDGFKGYFNSFEVVIIWGAGNLGRQVKKTLDELELSISAFWDISAETMCNVDNIPVYLPFSEIALNRKKTLIIYCIGNVLTRVNIIEQLSDKGYNNIVDGVGIRKAFFCPMSTETDYQGGICADLEACEICGCKRLDALVKHKFSLNDSCESDFYYNTLHFIVNTKCNLQCKYCFQYMASYPDNLKTNIPLTRIIMDIDKVMDNIGAVGTIVVVGGEPFLHPNISDIIKKISEKKNFGVLIIDTNGTVKIKTEQLEGFTDSRIRLAFSNYYGQLSPVQEKLLSDNIAFSKSMGITTTLQNSLPSWNIPGAFDDKHYSDSELKEIRAHCKYICNLVYSGKIFLCNYAITIFNLIKKYEADYIDLDKVGTGFELREKMRKLSNALYIPSCKHCDNNLPALTDRAGEQGFDERYSVEKYL